MDIRTIELLNKYLELLKLEEAMGIPPTELRALLGRLGEIYATVRTDGQLADAVNQKGFDVIQGNGRTLSVKTTAAASAVNINIKESTSNLAEDLMVLHYWQGEIKILYHGDMQELLAKAGKSPTAQKISTFGENPLELWYSRPQSGGSRKVWELADDFSDRSKVIEKAIQAGVNKVTAEAQYARWTKAKSLGYHM